MNDESGSERRLGGGYIDPARGLVKDLLTVWNTVGMASRSRPEHENAGEILETLTSRDLPTYQQYIREHYPDSGQAEALIAQSDSAKVEQFNALVAEFNADRERIGREKDYTALKSLWERVRQLIPRTQNPIPDPE